MEVDRCGDAADIAQKFAMYFTSCYSHNSINQSEALRDEYVKLRRKSINQSINQNYLKWPKW